MKNGRPHFGEKNVNSAHKQINGDNAINIENEPSTGERNVNLGHKHTVGEADKPARPADANKQSVEPVGRYSLRQVPERQALPAERRRTKELH